MILMYGACVAYLVIIASNVISLSHLLFGDMCVNTFMWFICGQNNWSRPILLIIIAILLLPISLMKSINFLSYTSTISVLCIVYVMIFIVGEFLVWLYQGETALNNTIKSFDKNELSLLISKETNSISFPNYFLGLPILVGAFSTPPIPIASIVEIKNPTRSTTTIVCAIEVMIVALVYVIVSSSGYFFFGKVRFCFCLIFFRNFEMCIKTPTGN